MTEFCLMPSCRRPKTMVFLESISCWIKQFRNCDSVKFSLKILLNSRKEDILSNTENDENFREVQRQSYRKKPKFL